MIGSHEEKPCRLFDQAIYTYLISCRVGSGFRVELSGQASQPDSSSRVQLLNLTRHFFKKISTRLELEYSTRRDQSIEDAVDFESRFRSVTEDTKLSMSSFFASLFSFSFMNVASKTNHDISLISSSISFSSMFECSLFSRHWFSFSSSISVWWFNAASIHLSLTRLTLFISESAVLMLK